MHSSEIAAALSSEETIPREKVLSWIDAAADSDLSALSKLYRLTGEGYCRIQPELGARATCGLIQRYLLGCIRAGVTGNEDVQERWEAAETLHVWFRRLLATHGTSDLITRAARAVTNLYLQGGKDVQDAIEMGFLEHVLETAALRPYFEYWARDARLQPAWDRALAWGKAHPDYIAGLFEGLRQIEKK